ncbi:SRPBCC domain-containing protein [Prolixibacteraceae bacterium JC049]|nr:SRPBCC domain-containing protein [Prolixibacteraceae bacterium JC049]
MEKIIVKQQFDVSASVLWKVITEHSLMIQWFFENIPAFEAKEGFSTQFMVKSDEREFLHLWTITEVISEKKIVYDWNYADYEGKSFVSFVLEENNFGTQLTLTHQVVEPFTANIPEFTSESCRGGWQYFINDRLKEYIEKNA